MSYLQAHYDNFENLRKMIFQRENPGAILNQFEHENGLDLRNYRKICLGPQSCQQRTLILPHYVILKPTTSYPHHAR